MKGKMGDRMREWKRSCFEGELTVPKVTLWLAGAVCLLAGIVYGLKAAPMTHGLNIGSNNGNNNGNNSGNNTGNGSMCAGDKEGSEEADKEGNEEEEEE